jgi:hypothetical protein
VIAEVNDIPDTTWGIV